MLKRSSLMIMVLTVVALLLAACPAAAPAPSTDAGATGGDMAAAGPVVLDFNLGTEPPSLDPSIATDTTSIDVINEMFLGLTELDPNTQEAMPSLATSWDISDDLTVWTFNMRTDVPWVRYNPDTGAVEEVTDESGATRMVTANDIVYGVKRTCDAATASDYAYVNYIIAGCQAANTGEGSVDDVAVVAIDDATVEFTLEYGAGFFGQIASMWVNRPMPQWAIEEYGDVWTEPGNINTNGPFVMTEWIHQDSLSMERNPFWYGWSEMADVVGNVEQINFIMIEEQSTAFSMYENNELDYAELPLEQMDRALAGDFGDEYVSTPRNCTYYYGFVTQKPAVSDVNVRKALSMAVDRQTMVDQILKGGQTPANTFTNPLNFGSPAYDPDIAPWALSEDMGGTGYAAALAEAQQIMADAGYPEGEGLSLTLGHNTSESHAKLAQAVQAMWTAAFPKIQVTIESQEWGVYLDAIENDAPMEGKPDVFRLGWCQDYPHANNWIHEVFNPEVGSNDVMISADDPQVGDAVKEFTETTIAAQTASPEEQLALYKQAEKLFIDEIVGIIPVYYYSTVGVEKPWLDRVYSDAKYFYRWNVDEAAKMDAR
ncbi:MAG: peptide ABC transporter substrate-binding protein [Caldilineaceae bacterium]|nr:peptide ABC transporter substrate-binding protein [Caldilineaceae bacterium]